jgi:hypothetical protein
MSDFNPEFKQSQTPPELKSDFKVNFIKTSVDQIKKMIQKMEEKGNIDSFDLELKIMETHPEFYHEHPFLVKKLCKKEDISMLYKMLDNLNNVENGEKSLASVELNLGNELANKYIYPKINK